MRNPPSLVMVIVRVIVRVSNRCGESLAIHGEPDLEQELIRCQKLLGEFIKTKGEPRRLTLCLFCLRCGGKCRFKLARSRLELHVQLFSSQRAGFMCFRLLYIDYHLSSFFIQGELQIDSSLPCHMNKMASMLPMVIV